MRHRDNVNERGTKRLAVFVAVVLLGVFVSLSVGMPSASAQGSNPMLSQITSMGVVVVAFIFGAIFLLVYFVLVKTGQKGAGGEGRAKSKYVVFLVLGVVLLAFAILPSVVVLLLNIPSNEPCPSGQVRDADGNCVIVNPTFGPKWEAVSPALDADGNGMDGDAHDAISEFPDSPFVACDAGSPDLNGVAITYISTATGFIDRVNHRSTYNIAVDDDLASTAAGYIASDCTAEDLQIRMGNAQDGNGDGVNDRVPVFARVVSITRTTGTANNGTYADVFYCTVDAGAYLGFGRSVDESAAHTSDHTYISYSDTIQCPGPQPTSGAWRNLGSNDGDEAYVAFWFAFGTYTGFSDYNAPPIQSSIEVVTEWGTPGQPICSAGSTSSCNAQWTYSFVISART